MSDPMPDGGSTPRDDVRIAILHAPVEARAALAALFALDDRLAQVVRTTREPMVGQMRLAWWRDALGRLDDAPPPAEPVLTALAATVLPTGTGGSALAALVDGWEELVVPDAAIALDAYAARGEVLFAAAARALGGHVPVGVGKGWALMDLALHLSDPVQAANARDMARTRLAAGFAASWPVATRSIGMLALLAWFDLDGISPMRRAVRSLRFRMTGRG